MPLNQRKWELVRFGEARPFHFQGLRMEEKDSGHLGLIPEASGTIPSRVLVSDCSQRATCFGTTGKA